MRLSAICAGNFVSGMDQLYGNMPSARLRRATAHRYRVRCPPLLPCAGKQAWRRSLDRRNRGRNWLMQTFRRSPQQWRWRSAPRPRFPFRRRPTLGSATISLQPHPLSLIAIAGVRRERRGWSRAESPERSSGASVLGHGLLGTAGGAGRRCACRPRGRPVDYRPAALPLLSLSNKAGVRCPLMHGMQE